MRRIVVIVTAVAVLAFVNVVVVQRERLLEHGRIVRLELAPVDPRSLMQVQGEYASTTWADANHIYALVTDGGAQALQQVI